MEDEEYSWREHFRMKKHDIYVLTGRIDEDTRRELDDLGVSVYYKEGNLISVSARLEEDVIKAAGILLEKGVI